MEKQMKEKFIGIGLGAGAALTLGIVWTDAAHAFSLGSKVTVTNLLKTVDDEGNEQFKIFEKTSDPVTVGVQKELTQFGGIWDIDFDSNSISLTLNSKFRNVVSGDDVYRFLSSDFDQTGPMPTVSIFSFENFSYQPLARFRSANELEVVFPLGFAPNGLLPPPQGSIPNFKTELSVEPYAVPTPALLLGLIGIGLAALRKHRNGDNDS
ncbi:hypothetical protein C8255_01125 [filamentous cyanobacterium CCP3]|nr:hypothetical protein C8255_01125 [filamentous cyanobacterium CCP3]